MGLKGRDFLSAADLTADEVLFLFESAKRYKELRRTGQGHETPLKGKTVAVLLQKPSLRTRVTFELAAHELGGYPVVLTQAEVGLGQREAVKDVAINLDRWVDAIIARVFEHETLSEMAKWAKAPVVNALSDLEHPCQALADLFTLWELWGDVKGHKVTFIGDGFNVAHSLMLLCAVLGTHCTIATPKGYEPKETVVNKALELAAKSGSKILVTNDPMEAVRNTEAIYTDVWTSMGLEAETEKRRRDFARFQVNTELLRHAPENVAVMHCLPAHRGEEITDEVLDAPFCLAWEQAENRLHAQKALLASILGG
ncbi:MAG: ornithine carbamoyltransferase [Candidatus Fervidibacter sp.]|uniref:ornithine carbamoyltransferase n=1 Tax=Candidatus Fervidibacter sp. TaxID=3100871 RepID=UPI00404A1C27